MPYRWEWSYDLDVRGHWYILGNLEVDETLTTKNLNVEWSIGNISGWRITASVWVQSTAVAITAAATNGTPIPSWSTFVSVTSGNAAHIVDLPTPVLWNIIYVKEVWTTWFEIAPAANTQFINGTECTWTKSLAIANWAWIAVFMCTVWW
jgi:hypothetical protein